jgi:PKHD-type hydroxylase
MNLLNYYYVFKEVLPNRFCEDLKKYAKYKEEELAITGFFGRERDLKKNPLNKKEINLLKKKRNSKIVWMDDRWIYEEIMPFVHEANKKAGWNFNFDWSETCQFTKYAKNQYYDWHCDSFEIPYDQPNNTNLHGKIRKLSVTCSLSDPSDYKGGELEFNFNNPEKKKKENIKKCLEVLPKGSLVVFPSFVWHRVCPVTKGTRYSLVIWNLGYPFQ